MDIEQNFFGRSQVTEFWVYHGFDQTFFHGIVPQIRATG